ncbi:hypothetical protein BGI50_30120 [Burkholderia pseudomallei]|nr:hypothetical protein BGI50_30120 [Burkholderia pseudomallei]OMO10523.1 hypothetical protein BGI48_30285 [Burkholderia pseudomallei]
MFAAHAVPGRRAIAERARRGLDAGLGARPRRARRRPLRSMRRARIDAGRTPPGVSRLFARSLFRRATTASRSCT